MRTSENLSQVVGTAAEAAIWAPSVHNTQPWSLAIAGEEISLRADTDRKLRLADATGRQMLVSCGAALFNIRTALRAMGHEPLVKVLPDPDRPSLLATIRPGAAVEADEDTLRLRGEIERRRTHRAGFTDLPVPDRLVKRLVMQAAQSVQSKDRAFSLELIRWAQPPDSGRKDGVPADGYPTSSGRTDPHFAQRDYARGQAWGTGADQSMAKSTGVVAVFTTREDSRQAWIAAGQALQRVLLHASASGVSAAFHTQALEMPLLREFLRQELFSGAYPQMIVRLGFTFDEKSGIRRSLTDVLE